MDPNADITQLTQMNMAKEPLKRAGIDFIAYFSIKANAAADDKTVVIDIADVAGQDAVIQKTKIAGMQNSVQGFFRFP